MDEMFFAELDSEGSKLDREPSPALRNKRLAIGLIAFGLLIFLVMGFSVYTGRLFYLWDRPINDYFGQLYQNASEWMKLSARYVEIAGSEGILVATALLLIVWLVRDRLRYFWLLFVAVVGGRIAWLAVLFAIGRPRPTEVRAMLGVLLPGFPSGHMMIFVAFFGTLLYLFFLRIRQPALRVLVAGVVVALLIATGLIRLFFTVHFFTDVVAGYGLGLAWTVGAITVLEGLFEKKEQMQGEL